MKVNIINKNPNGLPKYAKFGYSGMDLMADFSRGLNEDLMWGSAYDEEREKLLIFSGGRCLIPTGIYTSFPPGSEIQVRSRSGLALKSGVFVLTTTGTVDSCYRNEIGVILFNTSNEVFEVSQGDRIARAVLTKVSLIEWNEVESLDETDRGEGGFGSTGK